MIQQLSSLPQVSGEAKNQEIVDGITQFQQALVQRKTDLHGTWAKGDRSVLPFALQQLDYVKLYLGLGFKIFPLNWKSKTPLAALGSWNHLVNYKMELRDVLAHFYLLGPVNIGIMTGPISEIIIVDADTADAVGYVKNNLPPTPLKIKTRNGEHSYFRHPGGEIKQGPFEIKQGKSNIKGDLKAGKGYIVAPPSIHETGIQYTWVNPPQTISTLDLPTYDPSWIKVGSPSKKNKISQAKNYKKNINPRGVKEFLENSPPAISGEGGHNTLFGVVCALIKKFNLTKEEAVQAVLEFYNPNCTPPWTTEEIEHKAEDAFQKVQGDEEEIHESLASFKDLVNDLLNNSPSRADKMKVFEKIGNWLIFNERLLKDESQSSTIYLRLDDNSIVVFDKDNPLVKAAFATCGFNSAEPSFKLFTEHLKACAINEAKSVEIENYRTLKNGNLYFSCGPKEIVKLDEDGELKVVPNGTDGVLFAENYFPEWNPVDGYGENPLKVAPIFQANLVAPDEVSPYTQEIQKALLLSWVIALLLNLREMLILLLNGTKANGKTTFQRALCQLFMLENGGDVTSLSADEKDFNTSVTKKFLHPIDNLDSCCPDWFPNKIATLATGGTIEQRKLYTNSDVVRQPIIARLIISARYPDFANRPDIQDRCLPIFFGPLNSDEKVDTQELLEDLLKHRDKYLTHLAKLAIWVESKIRNAKTKPKGFSLRFQKFAHIFSIILGDEAKAREALESLIAAQSLSIVDAPPYITSIKEYVLSKGKLTGTPSQIKDKLELCGPGIEKLGVGKAASKKLLESEDTFKKMGIHMSTHQSGNNKVFTFQLDGREAEDFNYVEPNSFPPNQLAQNEFYKLLPDREVL